MPVRELTASRCRLALFALALGGFGIGASEFVTMGLLPQIAGGLLPRLMHLDPELGLARAGRAISAYALGVVVGAPVLSLLAARLNRRRLVIVMAVVLTIATAVSGLMPTFFATTLARFAAGLPHGAYLGVASLIAASIMGPGSEGKGAALALSGLTVANLAGVPLLTALGQATSWRVAYLVIAAVFAATALLLAASVPPHDSHERGRMLDELRALRRVQLWAIVAIAAVGFSGSFAVFSYIADIGRQVAHLPAGAIPWLLAAAGAGMTIGNVIGGIVADRSLNGTLLVGFPLYIAALLALIPAVHSGPALIVAFACANLCHALLGPAMQSWLMRVSGRSAVLGASLHHAAFNIANALGAVLGGAVLAAGWGLAAPTRVGACVAIIGYAMLLAVLGALQLRARVRRRELSTAQIPLVAPAVEFGESDDERATATGAPADTARARALSEIPAQQQTH